MKKLFHFKDNLYAYSVERLIELCDKDRYTSVQFGLI